MTPAELHSRILLHELRTILLDETREGAQIPQAYRELIQGDPHNPSSYLVLADELEDDPLGELCRIQVELIGHIPPELIISSKGQGYDLNQPPFVTDCEIMGSPSVPWGTERPKETRLQALVGTRMATYLLDFYRFWPTGEPDMGREYRSSRLGRTTRMLTDILRYCALNQGKHILVQHNPKDYLRQRLIDLAFQIEYSELSHSGPFYEEWLNCRENTIYFAPPVHAYLQRTLERSTPAEGYEYSIEHQAYLRIEVLSPSITFTDHACQHIGFDRASGESRTVVQEWDNLTCIGGPYHGQTRQLQRGSRSLLYSEHEPLSVTEWADADGFARSPAYTTHEYRRERFAFPRRVTSTSRPSMAFTYRDYLIHEDLSQDHALELIQTLYDGNVLH
jgi:hypothetical protein